METVLIVITTLSSAVAVGMTVMVVRMLRDERRRSNARVEALMDMAGTGADRVGHEQPSTHLRADVLVPSHFHFIGHSDAAGVEAPIEQQVAETDLELNSPVSGVHAMFEESQAASPWPRRLGVAVACAALVAVIGFAASSLMPRADAPGTSSQARRESATLDLLSLRHTADANTLTITGMVQNPRDGAPLEHITATAFVFADDGSFVASGKAPLDFTRLRPGDESPFVVKVSATTRVARYRVSFRDAHDNVIGHVDRRNAGPLARHE